MHDVKDVLYTLIYYNYVQVGLMSTGHYDSMVYSTIDKSVYHDSIAMAEDDEVGFNWI